jgi:hypothetical protein
LLNDEDVGIDDVDWTECDALRVCRLGFLCWAGVILIGLIFDDKSKSSWLSDCTKGLVGGLSMKLDEYDEESEGARDRGPSNEVNGSAGGNRGSSWNGEKFRGGDVESQD